MKAFISIDMEGLPHIVSREHLLPGKHLYQEARTIMTDCLLAVVETLHEEGVGRITVADSHGPMVNVLPERLPDYVELVRGYPRSQAMVTGSEGSDMAIFLGYHARTGVPSATFDHVYSGQVIREVRLNGAEASEFLLNAALLGERGIPIILVAGDKALIQGDVAKWAPWAAGVVMKESVGRYAASSPSTTKVMGALREATKRALESHRAGRTGTVKLQTPVTMEITFVNTAYAQIAGHLPQARAVDGTTIRFQSETVAEAYRVMELLVMAAHGIRAIAET